jgi:CGNR zinc finger
MRVLVGRLRRCRRSACGKFFIRIKRQLYCSSRCANQASLKRYRQRDAVKKHREIRPKSVCYTTVLRICSRYESFRIAVCSLSGRLLWATTTFDCYEDSEFVARLKQIHIHTERVRPIEAGVGQMLHAEPRITMCKRSEHDSDCHDDLRGTAEVLQPELSS